MFNKQAIFSINKYGKSEDFPYYDFFSWQCMITYCYIS